MLSISKIAVATMVQATNRTVPENASNWMAGRKRIKRVSVSERRKTRRSGNLRSSIASMRMARRVLKPLSPLVPLRHNPVSGVAAAKMARCHDELAGRPLSMVWVLGPALRVLVNQTLTMRQEFLPGDSEPAGICRRSGGNPPRSRRGLRMFQIMSPASPWPKGARGALAGRFRFPAPPPACCPAFRSAHRAAFPSAANRNPAATRHRRAFPH